MVVAGGSSSPLTGISVSKVCSGLGCAPDGLVSSSNCVTQVVAMVSGAPMCVCFPRTTINIYPTPQTLPTSPLAYTSRVRGKGAKSSLRCIGFHSGHDDWTNPSSDGLFLGSGKSSGLAGRFRVYCVDDIGCLVAMDRWEDVERTLTDLPGYR